VCKTIGAVQREKFDRCLEEQETRTVNPSLRRRKDYGRGKGGVREQEGGEYVGTG